ncbi:hypothetical protein FEM48_ZijujUnG0129100 [Ziziphus jujuba var. spinosa]|uniref:Uncharacterized protein n=1 Tax=Ziziphus jujuba var. spinosa TaxID=714518 RepID=A0A978U7Q2_ZIZJJ|nr:hypothetical protein FEM48_ZijujUnG0129100 [Ziziphus jujuba var. spinosa]
MAKNPSAYLLFLAILVLTTATSSSATSLNVAVGSQVRLLAGLLARSEGFCLPLPACVGVNVSLSCDGDRTSLGQAITNAGGFYSSLSTWVQAFSLTQQAVPSLSTFLSPTALLSLPLE